MDFKAIHLATQLGGWADQTDTGGTGECSCPEDDADGECGGDTGGGVCSCKGTAGGDDDDDDDEPNTATECSCCQGKEGEEGGEKKEKSRRGAQAGLLALQRELREKLGRDLKAEA